MMNKKRAVSAVVATVLIIMITVAAVGIIWAAIMPMIRDSIDKGGACFEAQADVSLVTDSGYTCIDSDGDITVQVKKGPSAKFTLVGLQVLVSEAGTTTPVVIRGDTVLPDNNEEAVIYVTNTNKKFDGADSIKIAPIVTVGKTEETCDVSQEVVLAPCSEAIDVTKADAQWLVIPA